MLARARILVETLGAIHGGATLVLAVGALLGAIGLWMIQVIGWPATILFALSAVLFVAGGLAFASGRGWLGNAEYKAWTVWESTRSPVMLRLRHYSGERVDDLRCRVRGPGISSPWADAEAKWSPERVGPPVPEHYVLYPMDLDGAPDLPLPRGTYRVRWEKNQRLLKRDTFFIPPFP